MKEITYNPEDKKSSIDTINRIIEYKDNILNEAFKYVLGYIPSKEEIGKRVSAKINENLSEEYFLDDKPLVTFKEPTVKLDFCISISIESIKHYLPNKP